MMELFYMNFKITKHNLLMGKKDQIENFSRGLQIVKKKKKKESNGNLRLKNNVLNKNSLEMVLTTNKTKMQRISELEY